MKRKNSRSASAVGRFWKKWKIIRILIGIAVVLAVPGSVSAKQNKDADGRKRVIRILATSDLHGQFLPWNYVTNEKENTGSLAQLASAIRELRDDNTVLVDGGDTIQGNGAELFLDEEIHPMIRCLNALKYDAWCTGNHEYNYGMSVLKQVIRTLDAPVITGNVYDDGNEPLSDGYTIVERNGVRIGLIGMVTPNCPHWDLINRTDYTVTDPLEETRRILDKILPETDVLIGICHMGIENEFGMPDSGVRDIAEACPEFDVIVASHNHKLVKEEYINGVLVVENRSRGQTMADITLELEQTEDGWNVSGRGVHTVWAKDYEPDPEISKMMARYDRKAKKEMKALE